MVVRLRKRAQPTCASDCAYIARNQSHQDRLNLVKIWNEDEYVMESGVLKVMDIYLQLVREELVNEHFADREDACKYSGIFKRIS